MKSRNTDFIVDSVVTINSLPGGFGQTAQPLPEPIEILKFKEVEVKDSLERPERLPEARMVSAAEGLKIMQRNFHVSMVPRKGCRICDGELPPNRVLYCKECRPTLPEDLGSFNYCGVSGE